MVISCHVTES